MTALSPVEVHSLNRQLSPWIVPKEFAHWEQKHRFLAMVRFPSRRYVIIYEALCGLPILTVSPLLPFQ
jgi:chorismate-pyruvate lyase